MKNPVKTAVSAWENLLDRFSWIWDYFHITPQRAQTVYADISLGSTPAVGYYALISAASLIASLGLVLNSVAVVIGAMLVSPLMTPIFGMSLGMVRGDTQLFGRAVRAELGGVILAIFFGALFGSLPFTTEVTSEMLARTEPTLLDLMVAVFAGLAGTLAVIDERISPVLPGVAISTAIVPPLSTCGLCLSVGAFSGAYGAFLLFFANFLAILLVSSVAFLLTGLATETKTHRRKQLFRRLLVTGVGFVLVAALLTHALMVMLQNRKRYKVLEQVFIQEIAKEPTTSLISIKNKTIKKQLYVLATVRTPKIFSPDRVVEIEKRINKRLDIPARLVVRCSVSKDISPTGTTSAVVDQDLDGTFLTDRLDPNVAKIQLAEQTLREILSKKPQLLLLDVDLIRIAGETVILASIQSPRPLIPDEIHLLQEKIRDRLGDSSMRLVARCQVATDVTSRGRILYGRAHFGEQTPGLKQVEKSLRSALACQGEFYVTNLDVLWEKDHWAVQAEIFGPKVITPKQVKNIEKMTGQAVGKPVKLFAWSRAELMVMDSKSLPLDEFTKRKMQPAD